MADYKLPGLRILDVHWRGWLSLLGSFFIYCLLGYAYLWGFIGEKVISYYHYEGDTSVLESQAPDLFTRAFFMVAVFNPIGPIIFKCLNIRIIVFIGGAILVASMAIVANYVKTFAMLEIVWIGAMSVGTGICMTAVMISSWQWFGAKRGLAAGILMSGFALGPSL